MFVIAGVEGIPFLVAAKRIVSKGKGIDIFNCLAETVGTSRKGIASKGISVFPAHFDSVVVAPIDVLCAPTAAAVNWSFSLSLVFAGDIVTLEA